MFGRLAVTKHTTQTQRAALASCSFFFPSPMHAAGFLVTHRSTKSQRHVNMPLGLCLGVFYCAHASAAARRSTFLPRPGRRQAPSAAAVASETTALAWCGLYAAVLSSCFATARKSPGAGYPQRSRRLLQPPHHTPQHKITASHKYAPGLCLGVFYCAHASAAARRSTFLPRPGRRQAPSAAAVASETTALAWCGLYAAVLSSCFATARKSLSAGYPQRSRRLLQPPRHTPQHKITASRKYAPRHKPGGILLLSSSHVN